MSMKARCFSKSCKDFPRYGGRGITMCVRWRESFPAFVADMGPKPTESHTVERRDNDGPYAPDNCQWGTLSEQRRNRRPVGIKHRLALRRAAKRRNRDTAGRFQ
jgi:hypothetical protein